MPLKQIRKHPKSKSHRSHRKSRSSNRRQRGGDPGRVALPLAYFTKSSTPGYYPDGAPELQPCARQNAVSQGVISSNGNWAGPNLYPMLGGRRSKSQKGGSCGCNGRKNKVSRKHKNSCKSKTSRKH
jgi:hypothetical protein